MTSQCHRSRRVLRKRSATGVTNRPTLVALVAAFSALAAAAVSGGHHTHEPGGPPAFQSAR
jgi:hypothetical protein